MFNDKGQIFRYKTEEDIMKEWFGLRSTLYERRKDYMLAKLKKEYEILKNKVRFIKAVIEETVKIKRVKRSDIVKQLKTQGFLTMSELNEIQQDKKKLTVVNPDNEEEKREQEEDEDMVEEGQIPAKEYDYLLTMPLWSLSDEKIKELNRQMDEKKDDHDQLDKTHVYTLWDNDLEDFLEALQKQEDKDERDRLAHKGVKNEGKKVGRKKAAAGKKKADPNSPRQEYNPNQGKKPQATKKGTSVEKQVKQPASSKPVIKMGNKKNSPESGRPVEELSLRERLALRANVSVDKMPNNANSLYDNTIGSGK
jgi:DNA topoisomerase-2